MSDDTTNETESVSGKSRERQYADRTQGARRTVRGVVTSTSPSKTAIVSIERRIKHKKYGKYIRQHRKIYAHDEKSEAKVGDFVAVEECRPMSKLKRFRLVSVLRQA
ncbi:MAG TPA: 30S ribosomal protein S17 [Planctomycetes bacterium]|nr:30S ribosomal protein S17 [Planctomycetota bacterium]